MKTKVIILLLSTVILQNGLAQKKKIKEEDVLKEVFKDKDLPLKIAANDACKCVDSVFNINKNVTGETEAIVNCVNKQVAVYLMTKQMMQALSTGSKQININVNTDENSDEYKIGLFEIQERLKDSCSRYNKLIRTDNKENKYSYSSNAEAMAEYSKGVQYLREEDYQKAAPYFQKAVEIDSLFAFAWDNLGICYRRMNQLDKAIVAYEKSLAVDSSSLTPLMNIAVAHKMKKNFKESERYYKLITARIPDNPEGFYGLGMLQHFDLKDNESALDNVAKAFVIYTNQKSPFRSDGEKLIAMIYKSMVEEKKEEIAKKILERNGINIK